MFYVQTIAGRTKPGQRQELEERSYKFHSFSRTNGVAGVFVTDAEYPLLVAHQCLSKIVDEFLANYPSASANPFPTANSCPFSSSLERYIKIYDNPENADSIIKIQQELDKTQIIMHKTVPFPALASRSCVPILTFRRLKLSSGETRSWTIFSRNLSG